MKFAQFQSGQLLRAGPYTVSEAEILEFARKWDPQWFHTDPDAAASGPFEGLIASGLHTCSIAMRLAADAFLLDSESYASPGLSYVKWLRPVRPGDVLNLHVTVQESRASQSNPSLGILRWRWQLHNASGLEVLDLEATSLFKLS
jgi:acyl dehydratase